jgi:hypothetical protein
MKNTNTGSGTEHNVPLFTLRLTDREPTLESLIAARLHLPRHKTMRRSIEMDLAPVVQSPQAAVLEPLPTVGLTRSSAIQTCHLSGGFSYASVA